MLLVKYFEVGEKKVEYEGTLNDLYENDLDKFVHITYKM